MSSDYKLIMIIKVCTTILMSVAVILRKYFEVV